MKKDGKYRFSLQFSDDTAEGRKAGELLESYGNRKSMIIVAALNEYLVAHPELDQENCSVEVSVTPLVSLDELERMVRRVVEERIGGKQLQNISFDEQERKGETDLKELETDVSQMLDNLDFFQ